MVDRADVEAFYGSSLPWAVDEDGRIYALPEYFFVAPAFLRQIRDTSKLLTNFFQRVRALFFNGAPPENIAAWMDCLSVDQRLRPFVQIEAGKLFSPVARFDFAYQAETGRLKMLEVNADTPCLFLEAFRATDRAAARYCRREAAAGRDPAAQSNCGLEGQIGAAFSQNFIVHIKNGWKSEGNVFVFSACDECLEDRETALYLKETVERTFFLPPGSFRCLYVPLEDLVVKDGLLYVKDADGLLKADMLYRLYPLEFLIEDEDAQGLRTGEALLEVYRQKRLILVNPPSAFLYQTKYMQSFLYDVLRRGKAALPEADAALSDVFLPTCNSIDALVQAVLEDGLSEGAFKIVAKPVLGREGGGIEIFSYGDYCRDRGRYLEKYKGGGYIFQLYTKTLQKRLPFFSGKAYDVIFSCFVLNGEPSAVAARLSDGVTTQENCWFMPIVEKE